MASAETRDVVKQYELQHNSLLTALRPGGSLSYVEVKSPCEALLVPRQISLEAVHIIPFLEARLQRTEKGSPHSPPPSLSDLFGEGHDAPKEEKPKQIGIIGKDTSKEADASPSPTSLFYTSSDANAFHVALMSFLEYHLLHFDEIGNSEFTTLRGQRGAFSEDLDHVKRFGHIGQVAVLAYADPLQPHVGSNNSSGYKPSSESTSFVGGQDAGKMYRPAALQIFIIDRPLMDSSEVRIIVDTLCKLTVREPTGPNVAMRPNGLFSSNSTLSKLDTQLQLFANGDDNNNAVRAKTEADGGGSGVAATPSPDFPLPPHSSPNSQEARLSLMNNLEAGGSETDSLAETIIINDFEEEVPEDPDLTPYLDKCTQISEHRRLSKANRATREPSTTYNSHDSYPNDHVTVGTLSVPGSLELPSGGKSNTVTHITAQVVTAPPDSSTLTSVPASGEGSVETTSTTSQGCAVAVTLTAPSPKSKKTPTDAHANVLRHAYSRECVKDYRRVVAADNEIHYDIFERLMALPCSTALAARISSYVTKNQQLQQPILNNMKYNKFISSCHTLIRQVPRLSEDPKKVVTLYEGIERYVTSRLYHQLYKVCEDEKQQNAMLQAELVRHEDMTAEQLDALPEVEEHHVWGQAMFELDGMDFFKSPREKLRCGMRACELLSLAVGDILRQRRQAKEAYRATNTATGARSNSVPLAFGADEFLPCFLLLVLRARPLNYVPNIAYIEKFRYASLLSPDESYCFATLQSAMMFWLNAKSDSRVDRTAAPAPSSPTAQVTVVGGNAVAVSAPRGSASVGVLTNATAHPLPAHAAPPMTENDLLPSLRHASYTARPRNAATMAVVNGAPRPMDATALPEGTVVARAESPTVLDVLFGWAARNVEPLVSEVGLGSEGRKTTDTAGSNAPSGAFSRSYVPAAGTTQRAASPDAHGCAGKAAANYAHFHPSLGVTVSPFPNGSLPAPPQVQRPDTKTRALVRELLITQHKTFEQLTLSEIQMVVEEARHMLTEKQ